MEETTGLELFALAFNTGIVFALVQLIKTKLLPVLRTKFPWAIPLVASGLGLASAMVLSRYGIDISPIAGAFTGLASSGAFAVVKEATGAG